MAKTDYTKMIVTIIHKIVKVVKKEITNEGEEKKNNGKDTG
jgi:hypothetical protein